MTTPGAGARSVLVLLSVLLGVVAAAAGYLLWQLENDRGEYTGFGGAYPGAASESSQARTTTPSSASPTTTTTTPPRKPTTTRRTSEKPPRTTTSRTTPRTTTPPAPRETQLGGHAEAVVDLVNAERARAGCDAVTADARLTAAAQQHSDDMAADGYLSHTSPGGVTFDTRIQQAGYPQPAAENIAMGPKSARAVMDAWMTSEGHRANILNCDIRAIGVAVNTDGWYWTQTFGY